MTQRLSGLVYITYCIVARDVVKANILPFAVRNFTRHTAENDHTAYTAHGAHAPEMSDDTGRLWVRAVFPVRRARGRRGVTVFKVR